jgi:hypothetical protein
MALPFARHRQLGSPQAISAQTGMSCGNRARVSRQLLKQGFAENAGGEFGQQKLSSRESRWRFAPV